MARFRRKPVVCSGLMCGNQTTDNYYPMKTIIKNGSKVNLCPQCFEHWVRQDRTEGRPKGEDDLAS